MKAFYVIKNPTNEKFITITRKLKGGDIEYDFKYTDNLAKATIMDNKSVQFYMKYFSIQCFQACEIKLSLTTIK